MKLSVNCPTCQALVEWSELSTYKPFCSERCRLIDLGEWASDKNFISGNDESINIEDFSDKVKN